MGIDDEYAQYGIEKLCKMLGISERSFHRKYRENFENCGAILKFRRGRGIWTKPKVWMWFPSCVKRAYAHFLKLENDKRKKKS